MAHGCPAVDVPLKATIQILSRNHVRDAIVEAVPVEQRRLPYRLQSRICLGNPAVQRSSNIDSSTRSDKMEWNRLFIGRLIGHLGRHNTATVSPVNKRESRRMLHPGGPGYPRFLQARSPTASSPSTAAAPQSFSICHLLSVCTRLAVQLLLILIVLAVLISCFTPAATDRSFAQTRVGRPIPAILGSQFVGSVNPGLHRLNPETGRLEPLLLPVGSHMFQMSHASFSPWRDEQGEEQVAVSWLNRSSGEHLLACISLPSAQVWEQIVIPVPLQSPPCWDPAMPGRLLFAAGDGQLYRTELYGGDSSDVLHGSAHGARPLKWDVDPPGNGLVFLSDPTWPGTPKLGGRILVSFQTTRKVQVVVNSLNRSCGG